MRIAERLAGLTACVPSPHTTSQSANTRRTRIAAASLLAVIALLLLIADIALLQLHSGIYHVTVGNFRDEYFFENIYRQEQEINGTTYRWTRQNSILWLNQIGVGQHTLLTLDLGGRPTPADLKLSLRDQPWVAFQAQTTARHYTLLLPNTASDQLWIGISSPTFVAPGDPRQLGVKIVGFTIHNLHGGVPFPPIAQYLTQFALIVLAQLTIIRLNWRLPLQATLLCVLAATLALLLSSQLLLAMEYVPRLAFSAAILALLTWLVLPLIERWACATETGFITRHELHILWAMALGAVLVRHLGVLYPSFGGQDLGRNLDRLLATINGQLYIIAPSGEFAKGLTIYPTGPYLVLMPGSLAVGDMASLMQGGLALLDGFTALMVGLITIKLGGGKHAARLALALYAANIGAFGAMGYSFSAQIFGQWFTAPLALLLLTNSFPPTRRIWLFAMILMLFGVFSHIGVALLGIGWMGLILVLTTIAYRRIPWWGWGLFAGACLISFGFLYVEIVGPTLAHAAEKVVPRSVGSGTFFKGYRILLISGLRLAYSDIGLLLAPLGLLLLAPIVAGARTWLQRRVVPLAWLGAALFFLMVDLILDVQVRYFYFALPLILPLIALPLGRIAARGRSAQLVAWALVIAIMLPQLVLWFGGTWGDGKIPMTPLTH